MHSKTTTVADRLLERASTLERTATAVTANLDRPSNPHSGALAKAYATDLLAEAQRLKHDLRLITQLCGPAKLPRPKPEPAAPAKATKPAKR